MKKIIIITVISIILCATIFSFLKFSVWNPFYACFGMIEILFTDKNYTVVQNFPYRVVFSKTSETSSKSAGQYMDEYMASRSFYNLPDEQMGAETVYTNGVEKESIIFSANRYYSKWVWMQ